MVEISKEATLYDKIFNLIDELEIYEDDEEKGVLTRLILERVETWQNSGKPMWHELQLKLEDITDD